MIELKSFANATEADVEAAAAGTIHSVAVERQIVDPITDKVIERVRLGPGAVMPMPCGEINSKGQPVEYVASSIPPTSDKVLSIEEERKGRYMHLFSGRKYYPLDPRAEEVDIRDIARSLSVKARYAGHTIFAYWVSQHSRYTALYRVPGFNRPIHRIERLLHDGSEAYNGDLIRPLKYDEEFRTPFAKVEFLNEKVIAERFGLPFPMLPHHKVADEAVTAAEVNQIVRQSADVVFDRKLHDESIVADIQITEETWRYSEQMFLNLFEILQTQRFWNESDEYWDSDDYQRLLERAVYRQ